MSMPARLSAACLAVLAWVTLVLYVQVGLDRRPDMTLAQELWRIGRYFTILTNALTAVTATAIAAGWRVNAVWATGLTLWMAIVGVVYHALLAREHEGLRWWTDQGLHTAIPLALLLWWAVFAPKAGLLWRHAALWLAWPGAYMAYALIRGEIDGRHPYFFIDPPLIGWPKVLMWIAILGGVFWLAGLGAVALGRWLNRDRARLAGDGHDGPQPR
ncbi:Pr6Pr family membrane protein [Tropicibacter naphthalenivorans]|uniref:FAR-17a/AIG1-like protein n=1 Tax=Tropicibacter naphthalenivorans TaxID=441103 RepID=A0A0P1GAD0_9RHOB|nr:Pr6Pr family membrane protein [Tropicibacter naphthalenivorans]CUH78390.1 hypothetical protein TRN7648_01953 [Tropicibacter naphthalenivorans]SMC80106.1 hypothetical protein SAMN04488093_104115 [Tropicibacter naphthalenivorans]